MKQMHPTNHRSTQDSSLDPTSSQTPYLLLPVPSVVQSLPVLSPFSPQQSSLWISVLTPQHAMTEVESKVNPRVKATEYGNVWRGMDLEALLVEESRDFGRSDDL